MHSSAKQCLAPFLNLLVHSLGNLVALDALRLHAVETNQKLIHNMVSVEAAVWEEAMWDQHPAVYSSEVAFSVDELMRGSWAFWFGQDEHPITESVDALFNSYVSEDFVLDLMRYNDALPIRGPRCFGSEQPGESVRCPRVRRITGRGLSNNYRVPVADDFEVDELENRPDLWYEIPAMLNPDFPNGHILPLKKVSKPVGMVSINQGESSAGNFNSIDSSEYGWRPKEHSWFLEGSPAEIWRWYENLTVKTVEQPNGIIPAGTE